MNITYGNNTADIAAILISLLGNAVVLFIFFNQKSTEKNRIKESIKRETRNTLFHTCDQLLRYSVMYEESNLLLELYAKLDELKPNDDIISIHSSQRMVGDKIGRKRYLIIGNLYKHVYDLDKYMDDINKKIENELMKFKQLNTDQKFREEFKSISTTKEAFALYEKIQSEITIRINKNIGTPLKNIMRLLHPTYDKLKEDDFYNEMKHVSHPS